MNADSSSLKNPQHITAKLFARGATQPVAPPDIAERMLPGVALGDDFDKLRGQLRIAAQRRFDGRHRFGGQRFVEIRG